MLEKTKDLGDGTVAPNYWDWYAVEIYRDERAMVTLGLWQDSAARAAGLKPRKLTTVDIPFEGVGFDLRSEDLDGLRAWLKVNHPDLVGATDAV